MGGGCAIEVELERRRSDRTSHFSHPHSAPLSHSPLDTAILIVAVVASFAVILALTCCPGVARKYPLNIICLGLFTLCEGYLVGATASFYNTDAVVIAMAGTVILTAGLTLFAWQTKIDFTAMSSAIFVVLISFMFFGLLCSVFRSGYLRLVYACVVRTPPRRPGGGEPPCSLACPRVSYPT